MYALASLLIINIHYIPLYTYNFKVVIPFVQFFFLSNSQIIKRKNGQQEISKTGEIEILFFFFFCSFCPKNNFLTILRQS
jgi:hypothetical protein